MTTTARTLSLTALLVVACSASTAPIARADPFPVEVWANGCQSIPAHGSGVAIGRDLVATVAHLVAGAHTVTVNDVHQRSYPATIVAIDVDRDAALLRLTGFDARGATLRPLRPGEHGSFFAFGGGTPERWAFTVNRALGILGEDIYRHGEHLRPGYELRAQVIAGDSGAGLVALDGSLGGLVWAYSYSVDGTGWGISIDVIKDLLHRVGPRSAAAVACP